jgi:dCMP deaminase
MGCSADTTGDPRYGVKPEKYFWMEHAERNAIYTAAKHGTMLDNSIAVITHPPCMDCARAMIQAGIKTVIFREGSQQFYEQWHDHILRSEQLFDECNVQVVKLTESNNE